MIRACLFLAALAAALLLAPETAGAATFLVDNTNNAGNDSLREAIIGANALAGTDRILITATGTINLQSELPHLTSDINIEGPGYTKLTVRRDATSNPANYSVLTIDSGHTVFVSRLTLADGDGTAGRGGVIYNAGVLSLGGAIVTGGSVDSGPDEGGGIYNVGTLILVTSAVIGNTAGSPSTTGFGGGIFHDNTTGGSVSLNAGSTVSGNHALGTGGSGGGIDITGGTINIFDSTVAANTAGGQGGGIATSTGVVSLIRSTVSANTANGEFGGGIVSHSGTQLTLSRSTVSGNTATQSTGIGAGGGIATQNGTVSLTDSTIAANHATSDANIFDDSTPVTVGNTILADPLGGGESCGLQNTASITSSGNNLDSDHSCHLNQSTDKPGRDPKLGPLARNGGPTRTMALLDGSPAIGAGPATCGTKDQRSLLIANDGDSGGCDIGAFEFFVAPFNKRPPRVHGTPKRGRHLRCSKGGWRGGTPIDYIYAWFRDSSKIPDYRRHSYRVRPTDIGHTLRCKITATNPGGETALKSKSVTARR